MIVYGEDWHWCVMNMRTKKLHAIAPDHATANLIAGELQRTRQLEYRAGTLDSFELAFCNPIQRCTPIPREDYDPPNTAA